jgi:hypothetical protein
VLSSQISQILIAIVVCAEKSHVARTSAGAIREDACTLAP